MWGWLKQFLLLFTFVLLQYPIWGQICGTPGIDGPSNAPPPVNTYYPVNSNTILAAGAVNVVLEAVPATDTHNNSYGATPISPGDLVLIIQVQDATIFRSNNNLYGSNNPISGPDGLGGTGYTSLGSAGIYEYAVALNAVPLTGGTLNFRGAAIGGGLVNSYSNYPGDAVNNGKKTFQVIRVPQYSSLTLNRDITCPPFNGSAGGIIAFDVASDFNFNGFKIDASGRGFRGGFQGRGVVSGCNSPVLTYGSTITNKAAVKGEGIAGTPRHVWNGFDSLDLGLSWRGFPGSCYGRGAPANGGGGGADHNSGGGGAGNGGAGGAGGNGVDRVTICGNGSTDRVSGGRPGLNLSSASAQRLFMGGGGGAGDADNVTDGNAGGVGGGIVIINASRIVGTGTIHANGDTGTTGTPSGSPVLLGDGAGGGGAGGTILLNVANNSNGAVLNLVANGGPGGNTLNTNSDEHGPGGGGGGGMIWYYIPAAAINTQVNAGLCGLTASGAGNPHNAQNGAAGMTVSFLPSDLPDYLKNNGPTCFPSLTITKSELHPGIPGARTAGNDATYILTVTNTEIQSGAGGVVVNDILPAGFTFVSATVAYYGWAAGPAVPVNTGTAAQPVLGAFNIPGQGAVELTMTVKIDESVTPGMYHNGAQALYLDPTRTVAAPNRLITPAVFSLPGQHTAYESGTVAGQTIPGSNFDGSAAGPNTEDVYVIANGTLTNTSPVCQDGDVQLTVSPPALTPPLTYSWTGPNSFSSTLQNPLISFAQPADSGDYTVTITDALGFFSKLTTPVIVGRRYDTSVTVAICRGETYMGHSTAGNYTEYLSSRYGCDSTVRLTLLVNEPTDSTLAPVICQGQSYEGYTRSGVYVDKLVNANGCDSIRTIRLTVIPTSDTTINIVICEGDNYLGYNTTGTYVDKLVNSGGCDSIRTINLTVKTSPRTSINQSICEGQTYLGYGTSGTYVDVFPAANGCDSTRTLLLTVKPVSRTSINQSICEGQTYLGYSASGTYVDTLVAANDCDSIRTLHLEVKAVSRTTVNQSICEGENYQGYGASGIYTDVFVAANGCDSIRTLQLTVNPRPHTSIEHSICEGESYLGYARTGTYIDTFTSANGCDSIRILKLSVLSKPAPYLGADRELCTGDSMLLSPGAFKSYAWQDGSSQPQFIVRGQGIYYVQVTDLCGVARDEVVIKQRDCSIYFPSGFTPNGDGRNDLFRVLNGFGLQDYRLVLYNRWGQKIFETRNPATGWDGTVNGRPQPVGSYIWFSSFTKQGEKIAMKGTITLVR